MAKLSWIITFETFHCDKFWSNVIAPANIECIVITFETSQPEIS
ncbi:hypothetical protein SIXOD_v1c05520 [Spiroplasma ixodetis Y32]|nr:hypothetical protein SIXOD_v1c05520 [Spiroplasma ixodetis Y32]